MAPEFWVSLGAVFIAGGAIGSCGTLLAQWLLKKVDVASPPPRALRSPEYDVLRSEVAELGRQMRNVDARLSFSENLLGGALPLAPAPERIEPLESRMLPEDDAVDEEEA